MKSIKLLLILPIYLFCVTDFELINYNDKSVTGDGVFVGVIDSAINKDHPNLSGRIVDQIYSEYRGSDYEPNFSVDTHGSHVAGIILAKPDGKIGGIATDAKAYGVQITGHNTGSSKFTAPNVYEYFKDKNIAAINNSWNATVYPLSGLNSLTSSSISFLNNANNPNDYIPLIQRDSTASDLIKLSKEKQILSVFASGNEGIISPGIMALSPYYDEDIRSIIVVTALDSAQVSKDSDGKFIVTTKRDDKFDYLSAPTTYSNGLKGVYNFSLAAPGTNINSVNASYDVTDPLTNRSDKNLYRVSSGTSMAAPVVTGAAALVAQKFPFMSGKQIADTLLSTANKDYIGPKIVLKETTTGKTLCDGKVLCSSSKRYTIFYVDSEIPRKEGGSIDEKAVEKDLLNSGYFGINWKYDRMSGMAAIDDDEYPWVQEVTKEDLFGQGILDIDKALKGMGILDANRLSDADVRSQYGETAVYYALDTKGNDAEFSNDISQRKWEADTHNPEAYNLPKKLDNLNVGLIKSGSGVLTLSGTNSYEGATVINGGGIRLLSKDSKTAQIAGSVYVNNGSILSGNGVIKQNLTNDNSIIHPGNGDLSDLVVSGKYTQTGNAKLILDFGNDDNSKLIANNYDIQGGILQYNPLEKYYTIDKEYKIDLGNLANYINNFTSIEVKENNAISFKIALDNADKQTINKAIATSPVSDNQIEKQDETKNYDSSEENSKKDDLNTQTNPSNPDQNSKDNIDDQIEKQPISDDQTEKQDNAGNYDSSEENSKKDDLNTQTNPSNPDQNNKDHIDDQIEKQPVSDDHTEKQDETKNYDNSEENSKKDDLNTQTNPSNPDQNSKDYIVVTPTIKKGVYNGALSDIREGDFNSAYRKFFEKIEDSDQTDQITFNQAVKSINSNLIADIAPHIFSQQESFNQSNMMLAINPVMFNTIDNIAHFKQSPTYLAYNGITSSDFVYDMGLIEEAKSFIWYLSPKYKKIKADNYKGDAYGFDLAFGGNPTPNSQAIFNINFVKTKLNFNDNPGNFESKYINLGANYIYDFGIAKFLSGASFGFGDNKINRQIIGTNSNLSSDYDTKTASLQLGLSKDFVVSDNFTLTPLVYTSGSYMFQDKFRESGSLFATEYEKISHFSTSITGGLYGTYKLKHSENTTDISLYSLYERRISGKKLKNSYSFVDFPSLAKISSDQKLNKDVISVGINSKTSFKNGYFISVGILSEYIEDANNINLMTMFGKRF
ncbi:S8 family serine peptidase [Campylobacter hyointestinalis]|uniref:S8 family serine peptidase n=1 Tax=Campylobacter hyointestinalis TaxID=198 RepID=UPI000DCC3617|nr:S8 family serine peptidase [Campylobacter hyointestinalis]RAZ23565.1 hypothetical protein CHL9752_07290 [Campylobacter hyointestinalis subsp. lawsonii]RAZ37235.1 hypothetical protein CHL9426_09200 [Campylobacter hyointestinalis subsp. lawsonii]